MHALDLSIHPVTSTLKMLASLLERITTANDKIKQGLPEPDTSMVVMTPAQHQIHTSFTRFHARSIPSISINAYLTRILKYCPCANECFLSLLVYFDRMARNVEEITGGEGRQFSIDSYNIHRLIIAGIMVSAKYFSDVFFTNSRYAKVGGLPVSELNQLEVEFLTLNNFALAISIEELQTYGDQLMKHWMCEEVAHRDADDDTASPAVPAALLPGSTSGSHDQQNGDSAQDSQGQAEQHAQESRQDPSRSQQHHHQYESSRRDARQEPAPDHRQAQSRHDYRHNHGNEPHAEHRREHRQEHMRDYRQEHAHSQHSSQSQHSQPSRSHSQHHHQQREQQQQQQQHHYKNGSSSRHHRPGHDSEYPSDKNRYHTPQQAPISPSEMTHATSRLAAPSPIH